MKKLSLFAIPFAFLLGLALPVVVIWNPGHWEWAAHLAPGRHDGTPAQQAKKLWTCAMHPQIIRDKPGNCPICGMKLVPVKDDRIPPQNDPAKKQRKIKYWRAPMNPNYISDKPGKSPMGMDLVPVYEDEEDESGIRVNPNFVQDFGIRTAVVGRGSIPVDTRTVGILDYNQKNIAAVNTKFEGWIENVHVNYIGQYVRKGEVLFEIYSPQLVTTQQEYLTALDFEEKLAAGGTPDAIGQAKSLLQATRERLRYWDITQAQIEELSRSRKVTRTLKVYSPVSGIVIAKMSDSLEGTKLTPGMNVYKIANLSTVWANIEVYEPQVRFIRVGQMASITLDAFPGRRWTGKIIYIDPALNEQTRTLKVSVEIPNPGGRLRPQMYANVDIHVPAAVNVVKVPEEAVLHNGEHNIVIVRNSAGLFEPREVQLGASGGGYQEVLSGLRAGETIVTSSQFLIDSESNLQEAINEMVAPKNDQGKAMPAAPPAASDQH